MNDRPVKVGEPAAREGRAVDGRRGTAMSGRDVAILRSLADRIDPSDAGAHNNLGVVFFQKGLVDEALAAFERALELDPRLEVARTNIQIAYSGTDRFRRRVASLREHLAGEPGDAETRDALARTHLLAGDAGGAAREWRALLETHPTSVPLHMKLAHAEAERGRTEDAERLLLQALKLEPTEAAVHVQIAELRARRNDVANALPSAERAAELAPEDARVHALLADLLEAAGRPREAAAARQRAGSLDPAVLEEEHHLSLERYLSISAVRAEREPESVEGPLAHYARALELRHEGDLDGASRELERALAEGEDELEVRQALAELQLARGDVGGAAAAYEALIEARPDSPKLYNERGVALHRGGRVTEAIEAYRRAVATDHAYALGWNNLGVAMAQAGDDPGGAERALRKAAEHDPPLEVLWNLALFLGQEGRSGEAVDACQAALERDGEVAESWTRLGGALFQAGRAPEARDALLRALDLNPDQAEARYQLGFTLSALGDFPGALRETKRALELDPVFPAPTFRLLIDVQFDAGPLAAPAPDARRVAPGSAVEGFRADQHALDRAFAGLSIPDAGRPAGFGEAMDRAHVAMRRGQHGRAAELAAHALALAADAPEALLLLGRAQLALGLAGEALERFDAVLASDSASLERAALLGRARSLLLLDRPAEAVEAAERAGGNEALALRARALLAAGDAGSAVRAFQAAAQAGEPDVPLLTGLGDALLAARRHGDAEAVFRRALTREPDAVAARAGLGAALAALNDHAAAEAEYEAAVASLPSYGPAAVPLAELRWRAGRQPEAVRGLVEFLQMDPTHVEALVRLGSWLHDLGRPEQAATALRRALRFDPTNPEALAELARAAAEAG